MDFSTKLKKIMFRRGLTQKAIGDYIGVDHTSVGRWLNGARPRPKAAAKLASLLNIDVEILINDELPLPEPTRAEWESMDKQPLPLDNPAYKNISHIPAKVKEAALRYPEAKSLAEGASAEKAEANKVMIDFLVDDYAETARKLKRIEQALTELGIDIEGEIAAGTVKGSTEKPKN